MEALDSLGRYGINSFAGKTCFVTAMFAHMLRLIIQNRFHLLLKYFSIRNSLSDVPSAPLFVDTVFIFVACAVEFQVGILAKRARDEIVNSLRSALSEEL